MEFLVLGPLEVIDDAGQAVRLGGARPRAVLASLLLHAGRNVSVDSLTEALWSESPPATAANALQVHVGALRKLLDPDRTGDRLVTRPPGYSLRVDDDELDLRRFEQLVAEARRCRAEGNSARARDLLAEALSLWRGPVLADLGDEPFVRDEAERLDGMRAAATEERIALDLDLGRHGSVIPDLQAMVVANPLREQLSALLMIALYRSGRQADALAAYRRLREHLIEELGIEPSVELRHLEQQILLQDEALAVPSVEDGASSPTAHVGDVEQVELPVALARPKPPPVGRAHELDVIARAVDAPPGSDPRIVLIGGEPGVGKSHLVAAAAATAAASGCTVLHGRCDEDPLGAVAPLVDALEPIVARVAGTGGLDGRLRGRTQLRRLFRDLPAAAADEEPPTADPEEDQARLLMGLIDLFEAVTAERPAVLFLDDLHWADHTTLRALGQLASRLDRMALVVVATYRDTELDDGSLRSALDRLRRATSVTTLELSGLGLDDARVLLGGLAAELVADLVDRTRGNPLFLTELARARQADGGAAAIPDGVRELVRQRVSRLAPGTSDLLAASAVCGHEAELSTIGAVAGLDEDGLIDAFEEATAAHLITDVPGDRGRIAFTHALVREALYDGLSTVRRRRLHRLVADQLEQSPLRDARGAIAAARHLLASDPGGELPDIVGRVIHAANLSFEDLAFEQARDLYQQVLDLLEQGALASRTRSFEVCVGLARAQRAIGLHAAARETCLRAVTAARDMGDDLRFAEAVLEYLWFHPAMPFVIRSATKVSDETKQVLDLLDEATASPLDDADHVVAAILAHRSLLTTDDPKRKLELAERAVALAERSGAPGVRALALHADMGARYVPEWLPAEVRRRAEEIEALAIEAGDLDRRATALALQVQGALEGGAGDVETVLDRYRALAASSHVPLHRAYEASLDAMRSLMFGAAEDVDRHAAAAVERSGNDENFVLGWAMQVVNARRQHGGVEQVVGTLRAFADRFANNPAWVAALAIVDAETGDPATAREGLAEAMRGFRLQERDSFWLVTAALAAEVAWLTGAEAEGAELSTVLAPFSGRGLVVGPSVVYFGSIDRYLGLSRLAAGDPAGAVAALDRAVTTHRSMRAEPLLALSLFEGALARGPDGDPSAVDEAQEIAVRLSLAPLQARIAAATPTLFSRSRVT